MRFDKFIKNLLKPFAANMLPSERYEDWKRGAMILDDNYSSNSADTSCTDFETNRWVISDQCLHSHDY